jgi:sirohydrochlorin cobaltochelatase
MTIPIVMAAFGTTTRALDTYRFMDAMLAHRFPGADIRWAYASRMVRDWIKARRDIDLRHPHEVLRDLIQEGHSWAVVQSVHMMCGHEFFRLVEEARSCDIRTSIGLPLLSSPDDYEHVARILAENNPRQPDDAVVLAGHGTDHPSWAGYMALNQILSDAFAPGIFVGMIEGGCLSPESVVRKLKAGGFRRVRLTPMMLVAGIHFQEDIAGEEDSWRTVLEDAGFSVTVAGDGLGNHPDIVGLFGDHIQAALDIIPR